MTLSFCVAAISVRGYDRGWYEIEYDAWQRLPRALPPHRHRRPSRNPPHEHIPLTPEVIPGLLLYPMLCSEAPRRGCSLARPI